jgi:hypothetical protein
MKITIIQVINKVLVKASMVAAGITDMPAPAISVDDL